ncbi:MAG: hypothetical protein PHY73_02730 [Candidatus Omnitrophica bacterium]|nr:hypothetical protein [Candidatus Omnitrophota bacterium]
MKQNLDLFYYHQLQEKQYQAWENKCLNCGACCGLQDGDPCEHLRMSTEGKSSCDIYENRFGLHKTQQGREFRCVPIRDILHKSWPGDCGCAYKYKTDPS